MARGVDRDCYYSLTTARVLMFIYTHSEETSGDLFYANGVASDDLDAVRCAHRDGDSGS